MSPVVEPPEGEKKHDGGGWVASAWLLFTYWKLPIEQPDHQDQAQRAIAKLAGLVVIFALGMAIRGFSSGSGALGSAAISAAAAVAASIVDRVSRQIGSRLHDGMIISAYTSTILVMVGYLVCDTILANTFVPFQQFRFGREILAPVVVAGLATYVVFVVRSVWARGAWIGGKALFHGLVVVLVTSAAVYVVAKVPPDFDCLVTSCPGVVPLF